MSYKVGVLSFSLGDNYKGIVIRDLQLWEMENSHEANDNQVPSQFKGHFIQYVSMHKLPLWCCSRPMICYTSSSTTNSYLASKLKNSNRGLIIEAANRSSKESQPVNLVIYRTKNYINCSKINWSRKHYLDDKINESLQSKVLQNSKDNNIDKILRHSQQRILASNSKIAKNIKVNEKKLQFNETLSKLILGGLRLRGIPNTQPGFQKLYRMTFQAAEFTHRKELKALAYLQTHPENSAAIPNSIQLPFEKVQETVETLLTLFTKS